MPKSSKDPSAQAVPPSFLTREHRHELRNIFSVILANVEMVQEQAVMDGQNRRRLERITGACRRGETLLDQMRDEDGASATSDGPGCCRPQRTGTVPRRIMAVDDEADVVEIIRYYLDREGFIVQGVTDSVQASTLLQDNPHCCDLLITDLDMPTLSGVGLCHLAQQIRPELPVILITGYERAEVGSTTLSSGYLEVLPKPFAKEELLVMVNRLLPS